MNPNSIRLPFELPTNWFGCSFLSKPVAWYSNRPSTASPTNTGKLCTSGLWSRAAHINYAGYVLWRTGIGMVSAPPWSIAYGIAHLLDFRLRAVPLLRRHMRARYGDEWDAYAAKTAVIVPGLL